MVRKQEVDIKKLRYVLYARRSTTDENNQQRSIADQKKDCKKLAKSIPLNVVKVVEEKGSAKKPGERPLFKGLLLDIEKGKYDAILCWHPDRLCRNMLEGGQIINMLDEGTLKDLRFHSHQFSNDANGKMLLGMLFVFSKQYSDDLSDKVSRGVAGNLEEGKSSGAPKWGYTRSEATGHYEPNEYFDVVKEAWLLRASGETLEAVTKFLNDNDVQKVTKSKSKPKTIRPMLPTVSKLFKETIYFGVLTQTKQTVDLKLIYDFQPMIDEETYNKVQAMGYARTHDKNKKKRVAFYPLRNMVFCAVCNSSKPMSVGKNLVGSKTHHVLSYECKNPDCTRKPRSLRAKHVFNSIYEKLDQIQLTDETYELYSKEMDDLTEEKVLKTKEESNSIRGALAHIKKDLEMRALSLGDMSKDSAAYPANEQRVNDLANQRIDLESSLKTLEEKIVDPNKIRLNREEFLNQLKTLPDKMRAGSAVEKDVLCRILFLNLAVDNEKVASYHWNEPFASLVKATELSSGGGGKN
ncbi:MAG: recombinase family protein [Candidatus Saccharibacteria bacterium]|nr:recombinase family protein [Candidatus Saccharibacteria bacterium]